jgi:hypothetical protein
VARIVKVNDNDYRIIVDSGGTITLDTGENSGGVLVTGNLSILGTVFNITADNTFIKDNIIVLNEGETGLGITPNQGKAGLEIDRGQRSNAFFYFDENISRIGQSAGPNFIGAFSLTNSNDDLVPLRTSHINTNGGNLFLINNGTGVISVEGTVNYESRVVNDDHIPNKKYVDDAIIAYAADPMKITEGTSTLEIDDDGADSFLLLTLNSQVNAAWTREFHTVQDIKIIGNRIEPRRSYQNLVLSATGTGHVQVDDSLQLKKIPFVPTGTSDSTIIYGGDAGRGESGVYFKTSDNNGGELISARRALAFSVIF